MIASDNDNLKIILIIIFCDSQLLMSPNLHPGRREAGDLPTNCSPPFFIFSRNVKETDAHALLEIQILKRQPFKFLTLPTC